MRAQPACCSDVVAAGAVPPLAALLGSASDLTQQAAAAALEVLCATGDAACRAAVAQAGVIEPAVQLMFSSNPAMQVSAAAILTHITADSEERRLEAWEAGAVPAAMRVLRSSLAGPPCAVVQERAAAFLRVSASTAAGAAVVRAAGAVPQLVRLLQSPCSSVRVAAARAVHALLENDPLTCSDVDAAGGLPALVQVLGSCSSNASLLAPAAGALWACMTSSSERAAAACRAGAVPVLVELLIHSSDEVRYPAAEALKMACQAGQQGCVQLREHDGLERIVEFLLSDSVSARLIPVAAAILAVVGRQDMWSRVVMKRAGAQYALQLLAYHCEDHWLFEDQELSRHIAEALCYVDGTAPVLSKPNSHGL